MWHLNTPPIEHCEICVKYFRDVINIE